MGALSLLLDRRTWYVLALVAALIGVLTYGETRYSAGYNAAVIESAEGARLAQVAAVAQATGELRAALDRSERDRIAAQRLAAKLAKRKPPEVVTREVKQYMANPDNCRRFGADFLGVFDAIHDTAPGPAR